MLISLIISVCIIILIILAWLFVKKIKSLAKRNVHFTEIGSEEGKLVKQGENIVKVMSNMKDVYYDDKGEKQPGFRSLGSFFEELGIPFFGITPIWEIYEFSIKWTEYAESQVDETKGIKRPYELIEKKEKVNYFKRFYTHAIEIMRIEMGGGVKIDMVFLVTFEILNIIQVIFKIKPDGIILSQAEAGFVGAVLDKLKGADYQNFRDKTDKSDPNSDFVKDVLKKTNEIIETKLRLKAAIMEVKYYDQSQGEPGDEEIIKVQTAKTIAEIQGDADIMKAEKRKLARDIDADADSNYFEKIGKVIGSNKNIAEFANLEQVKETQLRVYGNTTVTPIIDVDKEK